MLSTYAEKLLAWFNMYKITPAEYYYELEKHPKAVKYQPSLFKGIFDELLGEYGYSY